METLAGTRLAAGLLFTASAAAVPERHSRHRYCLGHIMWAFDHEAPQTVQASAGAAPCGVLQAAHAAHAAEQPGQLPASRSWQPLDVTASPPSAAPGVPIGVVSSSNRDTLCAGPVFNDRGVIMQGGGTLVWADGRRAQLDCGFFRNLVQDVAVRPCTVIWRALMRGCMWPAHAWPSTGWAPQAAALWQLAGRSLAA